MADYTQKDFVGDGYTTYHEDGSTSRTYTDMFGVVNTVHEDGSVSQTYDDFFGGGKTTYHPDGSSSHTVDSFFGDSKITYNDDGSEYVTSKGFFGDYYVTEKVKSANTAPLYGNTSSYDSSYSNPINSGLYDDSSDYDSYANTTYTPVYSRGNFESRAIEDGKKRRIEMLGDFRLKANRLLVAVCIIGILFLLLALVKFYSSFSSWFPVFAVYLLLPGFCLGFADIEPGDLPSVYFTVSCFDFWAAALTGYRFKSWPVFGIALLAYFVFYLIGYVAFKRGILARYDRIVNEKTQADIDAHKQKEREYRQKKAEEERREEEARWRLKEKFENLSRNIPPKSEYFLRPDLSITTEIPYDLYTKYGPKMLDEKTIRELAKNVAAQLTRAKVPFTFSGVLGNRRAGFWLWDYGETFFACHSNESKNENIYSAFVLTDSGELLELKDYRKGISYSDISQKEADIDDKTLRNCNITWYKYYEDNSHLPAKSIRNHKGRSMGTPNGIRSFNTEYEGIFSRLLYMISLTNMSYEAFALKYKYIVKQTDKTFPASNGCNSSLFEAMARISQDEAWQKSIKAKEDQVVELQLHYKNLSEEKSSGIVLAAYLAENIEYIAGSSLLYNATNPDGLSVSDDIITRGINIGGYSTNGDGYFRIKVRVKNVNPVTCISWFFVTNVYPVKAEGVAVIHC